MRSESERYAGYVVAPAFGLKSSPVLSIVCIITASLRATATAARLKPILSRSWSPEHPNHVWSYDFVEGRTHNGRKAGDSDMLRAGLRRLASAGDLESMLRYQLHGGRPHERRIIAANLARSLGQIDPEHLLVTSGAQHGLAIIGLGLLRCGDAIATDALTYPASSPWPRCRASTSCRLTKKVAR